MNYTNFSEGEITIYCGENARNTVNESLKQAAAIGKTKRKEKILYINTVFMTRKIMASAREVFPREEVSAESVGEHIIVKTIVIGDLCNQLQDFREMIEEQGITHVIINSWEFANRSYTYKERAI